jgi:tRNA A-37 threonylcarbamoyl transferase component Bud32
MKIIKRFNGHSGSNVFLVEKFGKLFVYKNNIEYPKLCVDILNSLPFNTPDIVEVGESHILMEYLPGLEMKTFLMYADPKDINRISSFLIDYIKMSLEHSVSYNFEKELDIKFNKISKYADIAHHRNKIPNVLPKGLIHGDLTLENIIFYNNQFYFIDANYTELNSIYFDVNKLRQDLKGHWFVREESSNMNYVSACNSIYNTLHSQFKEMFNDSIYALMLSRVLPYCTRDLERQLILSEIEKCK